MEGGILYSIAYAPASDEIEVGSRCKGNPLGQIPTSEERQERGDSFNKATSSGILYFRLDVVLSFIKDVLLLFHISPNPTSLNQSPNLNPTALTTTKPPIAVEPTLL